MHKNICIDFDGTLININSFPKWILFSIRKSFAELKIVLLFKIIYLLFLRKVVPLLSHAEFKKRINELPYPPDWSDQFCLFLSNEHRNLKVISEIEKFSTSNYLITTAAPCCYASSISKYFTFNFIEPDVLCSYYDGENFVDNYKSNKSVNTAEFLNNEPFVLFTDHKDDIELSLKSELLYLCHPSQLSLSEFKGRGINYILIED